MSNEDKDNGKDKGKNEGGVVLGGISFGVGAAPAKVAADPAAKQDGEREQQQADGPVELSDVMLPLRMVAIADLVPRGEYNAGAHPPEQAISVDAVSFDDLFRRLSPRIALQVESVLTEGAKVRVDLSPSSMKSFRPDGLVREVPLLRSLLDGRKVLERLRDNTLSVDEAGSELARLWSGSPFITRVLGGVEVKARPAPDLGPSDSDGGEEDVARILDMVDTGSSDDETTPASPARPKQPKTQFGALIAAVAHSGKGQPGARPDEAIALVDRALSVQLGAILQHPELRRLEEAWRGLYFLASRTPKSARLEVVSARPDAAAEALERAINAGAGIEPPVTAAVVDIVVEGDATSFTLLRALAEVGETHTVPILTNASAGIFGHETLEDVDRLDNKKGLFDAPERAPWRAEAGRPAMLWVSLALNRVLARPAYDKRSSRIREASVEELPGDEASAAVWMQPCWALASLVMRSFDKTGWPCRVTGAPDGGIIEDLTVREIDVHSGSERIAIPTEVFFSTETQRALGRIGLTALASQPNNDAAYLLSAATAYVPPPKRTHDYDTSEPEMRYPQTPLGDQLFVARLAQFLHALGSRLAASAPADQIRKILEAALWEMFDTARSTGPELTIDVNEKDGALSVSVTVRPRRFCGVQMEEISLGVPLG